MKRAVFISIIFCISLTASAQSCLFDRNVDWAPFTSVNKAISLNDGTWVVGGEMQIGGENSFMRLDCNGNVLWTAYTDGAFISDMVFYNGQIFVISPGDLVCFEDCLAWPCGLSGQTVYAEIYDTLGKFLNATSYFLYGYPPYVLDSIIDHGDTSSYDFMFKIKVVSESAVLLSVGDELLLANPMDTNSEGWLKVWKKQFKGKINSMQIALPYVYLATDSGIIQIDTTGTIIRSNFSNNPVTDSYKDPDGNLFFTAGNQLSLIDTNLNVVNSFNLSQKYSQWRGLDGTANNVIIAGDDISNDSLVMAIFDSTLSLQNEFLLTNQCNLPVNIAAFDSTILVTGNDSLHIPDSYPFAGASTNANANTIYYKTYNLKGGQSGSNILLSLISASNDSAKLVEDGIESSLYISLNLRNIGLEKITSISVATDNLAFDCVQGPALISYQNLDIAPGSFFTLDSFNYLYYYSDYDSLQLQFYVTSINGSRVSQSCTPVSIQSPPFIYNSIASISLPSLKIFPNPTDGIINIQSLPTTNTTFTLSDMSGRVLMERNLTQPDEQLNISALAQGMYIYTVRNGDQLPVTGKLVKE